MHDRDEMGKRSEVVARRGEGDVQATSRMMIDGRKGERVSR